MADSAPEIDARVHRKLAVSLFNRVWQLLDAADRSAADVDEMIHSAHASRLHWTFAGDASNWLVGEWQVSRVYAALGRFEPSKFHAERALALAEANQITGFNLGVCYEALARAWSLRDKARAAEYLAQGRNVSTTIADAEDRKVLDDDLNSVAALLG